MLLVRPTTTATLVLVLSPMDLPRTLFPCLIWSTQRVLIFISIPTQTSLIYDLEQWHIESTVSSGIPDSCTFHYMESFFSFMANEACYPFMNGTRFSLASVGFCGQKDKSSCWYCEFSKYGSDASQDICRAAEFWLLLYPLCMWWLVVNRWIRDRHMLLPKTMDSIKLTCQS